MIYCIWFFHINFCSSDYWSLLFIIAWLSFCFLCTYKRLDTISGRKIYRYITKKKPKWKTQTTSRYRYRVNYNIQPRKRVNILVSGAYNYYTLWWLNLTSDSPGGMEKEMCSRLPEEYETATITGKKKQQYQSKAVPLLWGRKRGGGGNILFYSYQKFMYCNLVFHLDSSDYWSFLFIIFVWWGRT